MLNFQELLQWFGNGQLKTHVHAHYSLAQASEALNEIIHRKVMGKLIVIP